jgi:hypothetical protein
MHPEFARSLVAQHRDELVRNAAPGLPAADRRRRFPRWHVSWTRTILAPVGVPGTEGTSRADHGGRRGSSLVIIISAYRSA